MEFRNRNASVVSARWKMVFCITCTIFVGLGGWARATGAARINPAPGQASDRQLIVLFDQTIVGSPTASTIVAAVKNPESDPNLFTALGSPSDAGKLLNDTPIEFQNELAKRPWSARARLEQYVVLTYPTPEDRQKAQDVLTQETTIASVEPNQLYSFSAVPSDRYFALDPTQPATGNYQWGMQALNFTSAWDKSRGTAYLGAVDNGIYCPAGPPCTTHADLIQNFRQQFSRSFYSGAPSDDQIDETKFPNGSGYVTGHGTHVAGILAATPEYYPLGNGTSNTGVAGSCWTCSLASLKTDLTSAANAASVTYGVDHGLQVINMSLGDETASPQFASCSDAAYSAQCDSFIHAREHDVVLVASSGNGFANRIQFPARSSDVIAVGGIQVGGSFWTPGYGNPGPCTAGVAGKECGSNYGPEQAVVAPAMDIVSTFYTGFDYFVALRCGDSFGPDGGVYDGYGDCTGTSMSAPHVSGIAGLLRTINPLSTRDQIKAALVGSTTPCVGSYSSSLYCGAGIPDAGSEAQTMLGGGSARNRLTPLFSFYSSSAIDHFYTVAPQMGLAAIISGGLLPQPPGGPILYSPIGTGVSNYSQFPTPPCSGFSPCFYYATPLAIASVFSSHVNPLGGTDLLPLRRWSYACSGTGCTDVSHTYSTDTTENWAGRGYQFDGIEGYIFPPTPAQPVAGTVKLCRKYDSTLDDYVLFPGAGTFGADCSATGDGYTTGTYTDLPAGTVAERTFIGWVYPVQAPTAICSGGSPCISTPGFLTAVSRKTHGIAGDFDLPLSLTPLNPTTEPRRGPTATIVMTFDSPISSATATVASGTAAIASTSYSGNSVIIALTGVSDAQYVTIGLSSVSSTTGGTGGAGSVRTGFLAGDVTRNRVVTVADLGTVNAQLSQPVTTANYFDDVNASGTITSSDTGLVNSWLTHSLPPP
jgi:serine protease